MSLVWYKVLPARFGGQKGIADFNEALGKYFPLFCVCSNNNESRGNENYGIFNWLPVSKLQIINPAVWYKVMRFASQQKITHVILEHPYHAITGLLLKLLLSCNIITHAHNIEYARFKQLGKWYWPCIKLIEWLAFIISNEILFKTNEDMDVAIKVFNLDRKKCFLMPYGTTKKDTNKRSENRLSIRQKHGLAEDAILLLFNGTLNYEPNATAINDISKYLLPLLPANHFVLITGGEINTVVLDLTTIKNDQMIFAGFVPEVSQYFFAADVFINPVAIGGGVQTKNIEAVSYGLNVVCWEHMLHGLDYDYVGNKILAAKTGDWKDFLARILLATIINDPTPRAFFEHYNFDKHVLMFRERIQTSDVHSF